MASTTTTAIRRLGCTAGLAIAAVAGLSAGAAAGPSPVEASEKRALLIRGKALNCRYVRAQDCMTGAELRALMIRSDALNRNYGLGRYRSLGRSS